MTAKPCSISDSVMHGVHDMSAWRAPARTRWLSARRPCPTVAAAYRSKGQFIPGNPNILISFVSPAGTISDLVIYFSTHSSSLSLALLVNTHTQVLTMTRALFTPIQVGEYTLQHRVVMAPLTRIRADVKTSVPSPLTAEYYAQRASDGGLLVTEATFIAPEAHGLPGAPGIWSAEQIEAWKPVTQAVHAKKGIIFLQLWAHGLV